MENKECCYALLFDIDFLAKISENIYVSTINSVTAQPNESKEILTPQLTVMQPDKLGDLLDTINLMDKISERAAETKSHDLGGSSSTSGATGGDDEETSARDRAIASLPTAAVMQKQLATHIVDDIKQLRKKIKRSALKAGKPGSAHTFNDLYSKIRRLRSFMSAILTASTEVLRRIYIRVFIDKQEIV